jgi:CheY-like chemotaxis protein
LAKVLIIEDDADIRENTTEMLELSGFEVAIAVNGKEGLAAIMQMKPDLVLCDIRMPELDGYTVYKRFKGIKETQHIPFIFFSASVEKKDVELALAMGIDGYIRKPFEMEELIGTINDCLKNRSSFAASNL